MPNLSGEVFTDEELIELEAALGDGFVTYTSSAGKERLVDVSDILTNSLWESKIRMTEGTVDRIRDDICDFESTREESFIESLEMDEIDEAPKWTESQPHRFNSVSLRKYFRKKFEFHRAAFFGVDDDYIFNDETGDWGIVDILYSRHEIYSKNWYELKIYEKLLELEAAIDPKYIWWIVRLAGELGRMIEHYRWKFKYGASTLRGKTSEDSLKAANRAKSKSAVKKMNAKQRAISSLWAELCENDASLSRYDAKAADEILQFAYDNPRDSRVIKLVIRKTGSPIGSDSLRGHLRNLRKMGKI